MNVQQNINKQPIAYRLSHVQKSLPHTSTKTIYWIYCCCFCCLGHIWSSPLPSFRCCSYTSCSSPPPTGIYECVCLRTMSSDMIYSVTTFMCKILSHLHMTRDFCRASFFSAKGSTYIKNDLCAFFQSLTRARFPKLFYI